MTTYAVGDVVKHDGDKVECIVTRVEADAIWIQWPSPVCNNVPRRRSLAALASNEGLPLRKTGETAALDDPRFQWSPSTPALTIAPGPAERDPAPADVGGTVTLPGGYTCSASTFDSMVHLEVIKTAARERARDVVEADRRPLTPMPALTPLSDFLAVPDEPVTHRVAGLWPTGGRIVLAAPFKAGKSTLIANLIRALVDGDSFLDTFPVQTVRRLILIDDELDERMLRRWLRDQGIRHADRVHVVCLRGRLTSFNILDPATRARWAANLGPGDVVILDCLRPVLDALGLSEDKDAGKFLTAFDELTAEAGIDEASVVHHMGHANERSRGDSRIIDWPDATWKLVRPGNGRDDDGPRRIYFSALGRDVDYSPEQLLAFDPATRHLSIAGGSRRDTVVGALVEDVVAYVEDNPGASKNAIETHVEGRHDDVRKAIDHAVKKGLIRREIKGTAHRHYSTSPTSPDPALANGRGAVPGLAPSPIERGARARDDDPQPIQDELLAPGGTDSSDDIPVGEPPLGRDCASCGAPLNPMREAYGKTLCVDCERGPAA